MSPDNAENVILDGDVTLFLTVSDPEADPVTFLWSIDGLGWQGTATPVPTGDEDDGVYGSQLTVAEDPDLDQHDVVCDFWDGESARQSEIWTLEVAQ
jgi:hypothetical protein